MLWYKKRFDFDSESAYCNNNRHHIKSGNFRYYLFAVLYTTKKFCRRLPRTYSGKVLCVFCYSDIVEISKGVTRSDVGEDIVTRETNVNNFSTVGITATFDWNNYNSTRKVQCSAMTAWHSTPSGVTCQYFNKSKSNGYVTLGKAYAKVEYKFYNTAIPVNAYSGYFKISCSDTGTISDSVG